MTIMQVSLSPKDNLGLRQINFDNLVHRSKR
jgi:hypothetical protein